MLDFKKFLIISVILDFLDSYTTYVFVISGRGYEANPIIASQVNADPGFVFILFLAYVVVAAMAYVLLPSLYSRLPEAYRIWVDRFVPVVAVVAVAFKSAVVLNNFLGITVNFTPIAYLFEKIGLFE
jgi:hypothetical protein